MNTLVIYDSAYGNTAKVAEAIEHTATNFGEAHRVLAEKFRPSDMADVDMLFVGSPTQGGAPTKLMQALLDEKLPPATLDHIKVAAFDTRLDINGHGFWLKLLMKTIGFAAPKIAHRFGRHAGQLVGTPQGFIVSGREGPLADGELKRAESWAQRILSAN